jgi:hypothetical protein
MITTQSRFNPVAKTLGKRAQFTVNLANRAHIMGILSGLYADPIKAVIRELSVNANESHKASGNKSPIKVTFPSTSGPTFIIKDEGLGLDIDEFGKLMASYGSSGEYKSTSNEYTGGFGLGCKAPAAYTDQWTITCIKGGKKWVLVCFKDEFGVPSFDTLEESETDEPNGVEVKLPVKANDVERFRSTAVEVFNVFRVKPTVSNATADEYNAINLVPQSVVLKEDNWQITDPNEDTHSYVVMGDVRYPINYNSFKLPDDLGVATNLGITFDIEVGGLQVAPSREALMYTPMTVKRLTAEVKKVIDSLARVVESRIQSAPTWWDACIEANIFKSRSYHHDSRMENLLKKIKNKVLWKGQKVDGIVELPMVTKDGSKVVHPDLSVTLCGWRNWGKNRLRQESPHSIMVNRYVEVYLVPDKKHFRTGRLKFAYANGHIKENATVYVITTKKDWDDLCKTHKELAKIKYVDYNTLPEPPSNTVGGGQSYDKNAKHTKGKTFELDMDMTGHASKSSDHWKLVDGEYTDDDWWIEIEKFEPTTPVLDNRQLKKLVQELTLAKLFKGRILAKKKGEELPDDGSWFDTSLQNAMTRMFKDNQALGELVWRRLEFNLCNGEERAIFDGYGSMNDDHWKPGGVMHTAIRVSNLPDQHPAKKMVELLGFKYTSQVVSLAHLIQQPERYGLKELMSKKTIDSYKPDDELTVKHHSDVLLRGWPMVRWATLSRSHWHNDTQWTKKYKSSPTETLISYLGIIQRNK